MSFTKGLKPVVAKPHKAIFVADHQPLHVTEFNLFNDLIKAFAFVVEGGANIFDPLIDFDVVFQAVGPKGVFLRGKIIFL